MQIKQFVDNLLLKLCGIPMAKMWLVIGCGLILIGGGYVLVIHKMHTELEARKIELLTINNKISKMQQFLAQELVAKKVAINTVSQGDASNAKLCEQLSFAALLQEVSLLAKKAQLEVQVIRPKEVLQQGGLVVFPLELTISGDFNQMLSFCEELQQSQYFLVMPTFKLQAAANELLLTAQLVGYQNPNCLRPPSHGLVKSRGSSFKAPQHIRDPFAIPETLTVVAKAALTKFACSDLQYLGNIQRDNEVYAIVEDPQGIVYNLKVGDQIGIKKAQITRITAKAIVTNDVSQNIYWRQ